MDQTDSTEDRVKRREECAPQPRDDKQATLDRLIKFAPLLLLSHLFVGLPTLLISLVVAYGTFVQADATRKIQQASAWPFLSYGTSNVGENGEQRISLELQNNGVGPALLSAIELTYRGRPVNNPRDFLEQCCGLKPDQPFPMSTSPSAQIVMPPGENVKFLRVVATPENQTIWDKLNVERWKLRVRSCYCSIFDECWIIDGAQAKPQSVKQCPTDWAPYVERRGTAAPAPSPVR